MPNVISADLAKEIELVLNKHGIDKLEYPFALGQSLDMLKEQCFTLNARWFLEGLFSSHLIRHGVCDIIKELAVMLDPKNEYNYNDLDCNLWGTYKKVPIECLECDSLIAKIQNKKIETKNCTRCNGTGVDPTFYNELWALYFDNHGNSTAFLVRSNWCYIKLDIRVFPYNLSKEKMKSFFDKFVKAGMEENYDHNFDYLCYSDKRDKGFSLSADYNRDGTYISKCEADSDRASHDISTITEHFPCVISDLNEIRRNKGAPMTNRFGLFNKETAIQPRYYPERVAELVRRKNLINDVDDYYVNSMRELWNSEIEWRRSGKIED